MNELDVHFKYKYEGFQFKCFNLTKISGVWLYQIFDVFNACFLYYNVYTKNFRYTFGHTYRFYYSRNDYCPKRKGIFRRQIRSITPCY